MLAHMKKITLTATKLLPLLSWFYVQGSVGLVAKYYHVLQKMR